MRIRSRVSWLVLADASRDDLMESVSCYVHRVCLQSSAIWRFRCERAGGLLSPASVYLWPSATNSQRAVFTCVAECDQCATCRDTFGRVRLVRNVPCASVFASAGRHCAFPLRECWVLFSPARVLLCALSPAHTYSFISMHRWRWSLSLYVYSSSSHDCDMCSRVSSSLAYPTILL